MRRTILQGSNGEPIKMTYDDGLRKYTTDMPNARGGRRSLAYLHCAAECIAAPHIRAPILSRSLPPRASTGSGKRHDREQQEPLICS
jgi:hypothetical protein